ncbi:YARHG domain-containing protein [Hydrogenispora sp. UU3]|uniref:YARHG domain-containing protein n=1 Tax=Capillibacterium thermochitinicola TaxID=2699427 RepID=A0A8J6I3Q9_9FIRM|nr:YARHG domain-containing protein [Capillibacterium thermochitinicola]
MRNAIYAKHGHIFASEELTEYFSRFDWYKPTKTVSYADLSEVERKNIEMIQKFEKMDENSETIVWGPEKEGVWQDIFVMAAGWSDRFVIYSDIKIEFLFSQMSELQLIKGLAGTYTIRGNVLLFSVSQIDIYEHDARFQESGGDGFTWANPKENTIYFKDPVILRFPVSKIYTFNKFGIERLAVEIGGREFYKMADNVTLKN